MKLIPANMRSRKVSMIKAGAVTLMIMSALGVSASASDPAPSAKSTTQSVKPRRWFEIGKASWYGLKFQGRKTAMGETFDMNGLTCAHRSLPLGSWVRVTNLKNRRSIFVRVNDRGPVPEDRIIDLSYGAARAVGLAGVGKVKLEAVRNGDPELAKGLVAQLRMPLFPLAGQ